MKKIFATLALMLGISGLLVPAALATDYGTFEISEILNSNM